MRIPLAKRLRKRLHLEVAMLQDEAVDILYSMASSGKLVFHGGTAIWRCYGGSRFSEDLDFYANPGPGFEGDLRAALQARGLQLLKFKAAPSVFFSKISNGQVEVKLELTPRSPAGKRILAKYEKTDGSYSDIYSLSPEGLIVEKMDAYRSRRYIRDIYDIFHLSSLVERPPQGIGQFLTSLQPPVDEKNLRTIVYSGLAPSFAEMVDALKRRFL